jgi:NitT/TauT family transport system ATP-binding protein
MIIECEKVTKRFGQLQVIDPVDLSIKEGEFVVLVGPSGCGKSTFLYMLAGFEKPTSGTIRMLGKKVEKPGRQVGFVFQDYALFPWKTVLGNVTSGLKIKDKNEKRDIALHYIEKVGLSDFAHEYPHRLSGGMKQRVGIARALAYDPPVLLMDEPFGALDAQTRKYMQQELTRILQDFNKTIVFVTHSVVEAVYLADRVVVFSNRPSRILYNERLDFPGERHYTGERFLKYREDILHYLNQETGIRE